MGEPSSRGAPGAVLLPIPDHPALELQPSRRSARPTVVIADLHLGLGSVEAPTTVPPSAQARAMAWDLVALARDRRAAGLLIVGDVKHPIVGTPPSLRPVIFDFFSTLLSEGLAAEVILGNHDVGLARALPREVTVHPASGLVRQRIGFFHGHRWPAPSVLRCARLVVGHLHPGFRFAPAPETPAAKQRCWVRVERPPDPPRPRRRVRREVRAREVVVLPAFNPLAGAEALNRDRPARGRSFLVGRFLSTGSARAYLLDGTDLGEVLTSPTGLRPRGRTRASPHR